MNTSDYLGCCSGGMGQYEVYSEVNPGGSLFEQYARGLQTATSMIRSIGQLSRPQQLFKGDEPTQVVGGFQLPPRESVAEQVASEPPMSRSSQMLSPEDLARMQASMERPSGKVSLGVLALGAVVVFGAVLVYKGLQTRRRATREARTDVTR